MKYTTDQNKGSIIHFRIPTLEDSPAVYELVKRCKPLDLNSRYCYMLVCTHFQNTSIVAETDGKVQGFISAYADPEMPEILFVWQVAVDASLRGKGMALGLLKRLLSRENLRQITTIDTTISPSNAASQNLFRRLASELKSEIRVEPYFRQELFGGEAHEDEERYRIGPFKNHHYKEQS
jgi:L-2,4-diaminobutyric acid acetyltransferase